MGSGKNISDVGTILYEPGHEILSHENKKKNKNNKNKRLNWVMDIMITIGTN